MDNNLLTGYSRNSDSLAIFELALEKLKENSDDLINQKKELRSNLMIVIEPIFFVIKNKSYCGK